MVMTLILSAAILGLWLAAGTAQSEIAMTQRFPSLLVSGSSIVAVACSAFLDPLSRHIRSNRPVGTNYPAQGRVEMTEGAFRYASLASKAILAATLLAMDGCATTPNEQSVAGLSPAGTVSITEDFVVGWGGGNGLLNYQGQTHPFQFSCAILGPSGGNLAEVDRVLGPGGGLSKITASGVVYKLTNVADFPGKYTQSSGTSDFWLQNGAGVIMHLQGVRIGATELIPRRDLVAIQVSH